MRYHAFQKPPLLSHVAAQEKLVGLLDFRSAPPVAYLGQRKAVPDQPQDPVESSQVERSSVRVATECIHRAVLSRELTAASFCRVGQVELIGFRAKHFHLYIIEPFFVRGIAPAHNIGVLVTQVKSCACVMNSSHNRVGVHSCHFYVTKT